LSADYNNVFIARDQIDSTVPEEEAYWSYYIHSVFIRHAEGGHLMTRGPWLSLSSDLSFQRQFSSLNKNPSVPVF